MDAMALPFALFDFVKLNYCRTGDKSIPVAAMRPIGGAEARGSVTRPHNEAKDI
jgi:hypothetical protein